MSGAHRECGTCSACCRWPSIQELEKPRGVACSFLKRCGYGCTAYEGRPPSCTDYQCSWIEGHGNLADQPDACGVLIDRRDTQYGPMLVARELPGEGPARLKMDAIRRISRDLNMPCLLVDDDNPQKVVQVRGPRHIVDRLVVKHPELAEVR